MDCQIIRSLTNLDTKLKFIILSLLGFIFFNKSNIYAQEFKYKKIEESVSKKNFSKSHKSINKLIESNPQNMLPYIYKAAIILEGKNDEKIASSYKDPYKESIDLLKTAKEKVLGSDSVSPFIRNKLSSIQMYSLKLIYEEIKKKKQDQASASIADHFSLFDNSSPLFESRIFLEFASYFNKNVAQKNSELKQLCSLFLEFSDSYVENVFKSKNSNHTSYMLKKMQVTMKDLAALLIKNKQEELADKIYFFLMDKFDFSSEMKRNYFCNFILENSKNNSLITTETKEKLFQNFEQDLKSILSEEYYFEEWNKKEYLIANTAKNASYLTQSEKVVVLVSNFARIDPVLFEQAFLKKCLELNPEEKGTYANSLSANLKSTKKLEPYLADSVLSMASQIHATTSGEAGKTGHNGAYKNVEGRLKHVGFIIDGGFGENCSYGPSLPEEIVLQLLVDKDVSDLGHRKNTLSTSFVALGLSIKPHKTYGTNCVLDFTY